MVVVVLAMLVIVAAGGLVVTYVAYPARGLQVPGAPWLGHRLHSAASRLGLVLDDEDEPLANREPAQRR